MIKEVEKYNPNGTLNVEYVEQLFDQLLPYEKKSFIENLAPVYGLETRPSEDYLLHDDDSAGGDYRSITDIVSDYDEDDLLAEISDSSIFMHLKNEYFDERLLEKLDIDVDSAVSYYGSDKLLTEISDDDIIDYYRRYLE